MSYLFSDLIAKKIQLKSILSSIFTSKKTGLGRKLLIGVLVLSSTFTIVQVSYQFYLDYKTGLEDLDRKAAQIHTSYKDTLVSSIWSVNLTGLKTVAEGMLSLPSVEAISIVEVSNNNNDKLIDISTGLKGDFITKNTDLIVIGPKGAQKIGELNVTLDLKPLYEGLYEKLFYVLIYQAIKTFSVSILIFAMFHYLVTKHLIHMASFASSTHKNNLDEKIVLDRSQPTTEDELDTLALALNKARSSTRLMVKSNLASANLRTELEKKDLEYQKSTKHQQEIEQENTILGTTIDDLKKEHTILIQSEKMSASGKIISSIANELESPVNSSIAASVLLQRNIHKLKDLFESEELSDAELVLFFKEFKSLETTINTNLDSAEQLIHSFKQVSTDQNDLTLSDFNLYDNFSNTTLSLLAPFKNKNIQILNKIPRDIMVSSYPTAFIQIHTHLLKNALQHAFVGRESGTVVINAEQSYNQLIIRFCDNGIGMTDEVKDQIFDAFYTTNKDNGNTGFGMSLFHHLVTEKLEGQVELETKIGKGTCFTIQMHLFD